MHRDTQDTQEECMPRDTHEVCRSIHPGYPGGMMPRDTQDSQDHVFSCKMNHCAKAHITCIPPEGMEQQLRGPSLKSRMLVDGSLNGVRVGTRPDKRRRS